MLNKEARQAIALKKFSLIRPVLNGQVKNQREHFDELRDKPIEMPYLGARKYDIIIYSLKGGGKLPFFKIKTPILCGLQDFICQSRKKQEYKWSCFLLLFLEFLCYIYHLGIFGLFRKHYLYAATAVVILKLYVAKASRF
ncbi:MAG: hypothetical protein QME46_07230 [Thermoanaerobacteraceae bacterium]|nr:hypothetical protein [Thermoanaerobacteraceae bacterium]